MLITRRTPGPFSPLTGYRTGYSVTRACNAAFSASGSSFPLFSARRKIPAQAFGLKEYRCRWSPVVSKMSDNKDTPAPLWHSEILAIKYAPCNGVLVSFDDACLLELLDSDISAGEP